jgi:hypothetical protein
LQNRQEQIELICNIADKVFILLYLVNEWFCGTEHNSGCIYYFYFFGIFSRYPLNGASTEAEFIGDLFVGELFTGQADDGRFHPGELGFGSFIKRIFLSCQVSAQHSIS